MPLLQVPYPWRSLALFLGVLLSGACGGGPVSIQSPRPLIVPSGARIQPDSVRLDSINAWVQELERVITEDPSFLSAVETIPQPVQPWQTLEFRGEDTVRTAITRASDATLSFHIYGFLHLMQRRGRLAEWFPDAAALEGYDLERFIVARTAESWLLGRAVYDTAPYPPLDELVYAQDRGYLDAFLLTTRGDEFSETRDAWAEENPDASDEFRSWYRETFDRDPPGPPAP